MEKIKNTTNPPARFLFSIPSLTYIEMLWYILFSSFQIWRSQLRITEKPKKAIDCREAIGDRYAYSISLFFCFVSAWGERRTHKNRVQKEKEEEKKKKPVPEKNKINKTSPLGINCVFQVGHDTALLPYRMDRYARWMCVVKKKWVKYTEYFCSLKGERDQSLN